MKTTTVAISHEEFKDHGHVNVDLSVHYDPTYGNEAALRLLNDAYAEARRRIE